MRAVLKSLRYGAPGGRARARPASVVAAVVVVSLAASACGGGSENRAASDDVPLVVATTSIWGDVVRSITGDEARVEVLLPRGVDPHAFQPSPKHVARLREADLIVANGLGLEESLADAVAGAQSDGIEVLELAGQLEPLRFDEHADDDHSGRDPHVWQDPLRVADATALIADALAAIEPSGAFETGARAYADEIHAMHRRIERLVSDVPEDRRQLVTTHDSLGYFAARYGFEVVGVVIEGGSTLSDPSAANVARVADAIDDAGVRAIFTETVASERLARTIRREVGGDVELVTVYTDSLGDAGSPGSTYLGMMLENARRVSGALR